MTTTDHDHVTYDIDPDDLSDDTTEEWQDFTSDVPGARAHALRVVGNVGEPC